MFSCPLNKVTWLPIIPRKGKCWVCDEVSRGLKDAEQAVILQPEVPQSKAAQQHPAHPRNVSTSPEGAMLVTLENTDSIQYTCLIAPQVKNDWLRWPKWLVSITVLLRVGPGGYLPQSAGKWWQCRLLHPSFLGKGLLGMCFFKAALLEILTHPKVQNYSSTACCVWNVLVSFHPSI